jgi:hypothetical protein
VVLASCERTAVDLCAGGSCGLNAGALSTYVPPSPVHARGYGFDKPSGNSQRHSFEHDVLVTDARDGGLCDVANGQNGR